MDTGSFIAIDSGGSRLRGYAWPSDREFSGDGSIHSSSVALDLARNITAALPEEITEVETIVLSLAGIPHNKSDQELLAAAISQRVIFSKLLITSDTHAAALSVDSHSDLVITVGTGITALVTKDDKIFDLTGHGYLIGDEASGYWIGRQGLNAALKGIEGRGIETSLTQVAQNFYQITAAQLADYVHQLGNPVTKLQHLLPLSLKLRKTMIQLLSRY